MSLADSSDLNPLGGPDDAAMHGFHRAELNGYRIRVRGQVQGVGYRPFVWQIAQRMGVRGTVLNDPRGVLITAVGGDIEGFFRALRDSAPPLARVDRITRGEYVFTSAPRSFQIVPSHGKGAHTGITPDAATCPDCVAEINQPGGRRYGYAFTNCTHCGPRFSILRQLPYDRANTAMSAFAMCPDCAAQYGDPSDRRFHAQPIACPNCGPQLWFEDGGNELPENPIGAAIAYMKAGRIVAIKGIGGFHLACDASNAAAIQTLRDRKQRPTKPLALMGSFGMVRRYAKISATEADLLSDPAAPIVLLTKNGRALPENIAPNQKRLGWTLPYTPLHHLLIAGFNGPLVMTSGNLSGEPQVIDNSDARAKLADIADAFLMHDRQIVRRLDDSVEQITPHGPMILRRGRGRVPSPLPLPPGFQGVPDIVAYGGHLKSAICLTKDNEALLSHHLGDLDNAPAWDAFCQADRDYAALLDHEPQIVAHDLHPDYRSSINAARKSGKRVAVQHHHAHLASCLGENGWPLDEGPVAGIILDGLGLGSDGTIWGGELLLGDYRAFERVAHLRPGPLIGGDAAQREPWRNLLARLDQAEMCDLADELLKGNPVNTLRRAATSGINAPMSSSIGRLFDAFAAGLGICRDAQSFEGEAAMALESLAQQSNAGLNDPYPMPWTGMECDPAPMFRAWADDRRLGKPASVMAARFHASVARAFCEVARHQIDAGLAKAIVLSGGCFQNATLLNLCMAELSDLPVMIHTKTPANDGGLAFGQALVAAAVHLAEADHA